MARRGWRAGHGCARPAPPSAGPHKTAAPGAGPRRGPTAPASRAASACATRYSARSGASHVAGIPAIASFASSSAAGELAASGGATSPLCPQPGLCPEVVGPGERLAFLSQPQRLAQAPLRVDRLGEHGGHGCAPSAVAHRAEGLVPFPQVPLGRGPVTRRRSYHCCPSRYF